MKHIVHVLGPTGVGKSHWAVRLAEHFDGEIVSADSMQVYCGFDIGTDKVPQEIRRRVAHHLIDIVADCQQFQAAKYLQRAEQAIRSIQKRGRLPIVCGGSALYLKTLIRGIFPEDFSERTVRESLRLLEKEEGLAALFRKLQAIDPEYAQRIGANDRIRIMRALEILQHTGKPPSQMFRHNQAPLADCHHLRIGLNLPRVELYQVIDRRVERMIAEGLLEEVRRLRQIYPASCPPFRGVGYREMLRHLNGEIDFTTTIRLIQQRSRNFAKRQLSWFRQEKDIHWFSPQQAEDIMNFLEESLWKNA